MKTMVIQVEEMKTFLTQITGSNGKGQRSLIFDRTYRNMQTYAAKAYAAECVDMSARQQAREENNHQKFVLDSGARHRPSKKKSTEGSFVTTMKGKKAKKEKYI